LNLRRYIQVLLYGSVVVMSDDYFGTDVNPGDTTTAACTAEGRGLHSSTSQLNLSGFCHKKTP